MKFKLFILLICIIPNVLPAQLEIEGSIGFDMSRAQIDEVDFDVIGIPQQMGSYRALGIGLSVYNKLNKNTRIGFGFSAYRESTIDFTGNFGSIDPINKYLFNELKLSLGLKQVFLNNCFFKFNASLHSLYRPKVEYLSNGVDLLPVRRAFLGPEIRLGYTFKNIFIEVLCFYNVRTFTDDSVRSITIIHFNNLHKTISLGLNVGYKLNYPNKKALERKIKDRLGH